MKTMKVLLSFGAPIVMKVLVKLMGGLQAKVVTRSKWHVR